MGIVVAGIWGVAEATLFFLVPDLWLSRLCITHSLRYAALAAVVASLAAVFGGCLMLLWSQYDLMSALAWVEAVPAISSDMTQKVHAQLSAQGLVSLFIGAFSGIPYKIYAVQVAHSELSPWFFLLATIPARLSRFLLVVWVAHRLSDWLRRRYTQRVLLRLWAALWTCFYVGYLWWMPG
ncbi:hypothetical protein [Sedimenticola selenatireducens]|uniref:DedA family protein n=1 Tax=Sedimenticola selenatireducens TaxID=191960 RepID=A0A557SHU4_9GAMM|nr:hypothetical protein [Sedimenticola selenatireducens]TVO76987.1 hypothetical protein FHP88_06070 [Sedimenticola selenatireducens]TVT64430.1 MAG: hypothetical protein FHK78_09315 [Sedimenticola selenatireducens]